MDVGYCGIGGYCLQFGNKADISNIGDGDDVSGGVVGGGDGTIQKSCHQLKKCKL